jgi:hypothetical protein
VLPPGDPQGRLLLVVSLTAQVSVTAFGTVAAIACECSDGNRERKTKGHQARSDFLHDILLIRFASNERLAAPKPHQKRNGRAV